MLKCYLKLEHQAIPQLKDALLIVGEVKDYVSREVFFTSRKTKENILTGRKPGLN